MDAVEYLLAALRASPADELAWLALADGLEEGNQPARAELTRLTRQLLALPRDAPSRPEQEQRLQSLLREGARPCLPQIANSLGMRFGMVPPGSFLLGSPESEAERFGDEALHEVAFEQPFYVGITTVTQSQYAALVPGTPQGPYLADELPAHNVSHSDALAFCQALSELPAERRAGRSYRLPTEAEWEYSCRAGTTTAYHHGPELTREMAAFGRAHEQGPELVATFPPNAFGLYDMHGGVWEWCADWFDDGYYARCPRVAPPGPETGRVRVIRGGSWMSDRDFCRAACREYAGPDSHRPRDGFRLVLVPA